MAVTMKKVPKPIPPPVKTDPELGHISRDEFIARRRRQKELEAKMADFSLKAKAEIEAEESKPVIQEKPLEQPSVPEVKEPKKKATKR